MADAPRWMTAGGAPSSAHCAAVERRFGDLQVVRWSGAHREVLAQPRTGPENSWPLLLVYACSGASKVHHEGTTTTIQQGDIVAFTHDRVALFDSEDDAVILFVHVPAHSVGPYRAALRAAEGRVINTSCGTPQLVARVLEGLALELTNLAPLHPARLARHIVGLVALACEDGAHAVDASLGTDEDANVARAKEYIETHLSEIDLSPHRVARALNMSIRALHRCFEHEDLSVAGWIRSQRFEHCRSELADGAYDDEPVSVIGARWGFWDAAHFSKLFKSQFQLSPRAYRGQVARRRESDAKAL